MRAHMNDEEDRYPFKAAETVSMANRAYEMLRKAIEAGTLQPRMRLREDHLAGWLEMSRTPVREAVRRLEAEGFFTRDSRTLVVASLDQQSVAELYSMREVLEGTASAFAAMQASEFEISTLLELCDIEARLLDKPDDVVHHNERFHAAIYGAAHHRYLIKALGSLRDARALLGPSTLTGQERIRSAHAEHVAIVAAIEKRDPRAAEEAARRHIRSAVMERLRRLSTSANSS
jgi:DNA-binding GntR family transcriptional regulator